MDEISYDWYSGKHMTKLKKYAPKFYKYLCSLYPYEWELKKGSGTPSYKNAMLARLTVLTLFGKIWYKMAHFEHTDLCCVDWRQWNRKITASKSVGTHRGD